VKISCSVLCYGWKYRIFNIEKRGSRENLFLQQSTSPPRGDSWVTQTRLWRPSQGGITLTSVVEEMPFTIRNFPRQVRRL